MNEYTSYIAPKIENGADGLPHCTRCNGERDLCAYHRKQVRIGIGMLKTPTLYCGPRDISYLMKSTSDFGDTE